MQDISLSIAQGEVRVLAGENGAGKSTLVKCIAGIVRPSSGQIEGNVRIAMVHQELSLVDELTVLDNLFLGKEQSFLGIVQKGLHLKMANELLLEMDYQVDLGAIVKTLSLPEKNMVEIIKALLQRPDLLILDEPTSSLSPRLTKILFAQIKKLKVAGCGIFYISHKMDELKEIADTITILRDGQLVLTEGFHKISMDQIIKAMVGRDIEDFYPSKEIGPDDLTQLKLKDFSVPYVGSEFGRDYFVYPTDLEIKKGSVLGFVGLEGAGHSEFLKHLYTHKKFWGDKRIAFMPNDRKGLGLILNSSIEKNLTLPLITESSSWKFLRLNHLKNRARDISFDVKLKYCNLNDEVSTLSGGNQQKIVLAKWLMMNPDIILMDEPTRGVDIGAKAEIYTLIRNFVAQGKSVVLYSTELIELMGLCDRLMVFHKGRITGEFTDITVNESLQEKIMQKALGVADESESNQKHWDGESSFAGSSGVDLGDLSGVYI
ncbi:MAG TPA: sugar ABC transporter ATP-binding protein [Bacteriovoracaceae bacterium]|nr:sugar ABC transporter ATP-binding protein [Bacteriovoracaceae bacterium]